MWCIPLGQTYTVLMQIPSSFCNLYVYTSVTPCVNIYKRFLKINKYKTTPSNFWCVRDYQHKWINIIITTANKSTDLNVTYYPNNYTNQHI